MKENSDSHTQLYSFISDGQTFAVRAHDVKEVRSHHELSTITPVFHAPDIVRGYINVRGEINLVLDFRKLTGNEAPRPPSEDLIFFKESTGPAFGILVDKAGEIFSSKNSDLEEWTSSHDMSSGTSSVKNRYTVSICKTEKGLISVLDPSRFMTV